MKNLEIFPVKIHIGYPQDLVGMTFLLDSLNIEKEVEPVNNRWDCDLYTSHFKDKTKRDISWTKNFCDHIKNNILNYTQELKENIYIFQIPWINLYKKNNFQETHNHTGIDNNLSYCYFYKLPKKTGCAEFIFKNQDGVCYTPDIEEGQLIVFPSWLDHMVTQHEIEDLRITISGNITVRKKELYGS